MYEAQCMPHYVYTSNNDIPAKNIIYIEYFQF